MAIPGRRPDPSRNRLSFGSESHDAEHPSGQSAEERPLADRLRPSSLDQVFGQEHLTGPGRPLRLFFERGEIPSMIFWGPPGSGKTTLARILGSHPKFFLEQFSAVLSGVKDVRAVVDRAGSRLDTTGVRTILFVDEIHRFNRAQQDAFLPHVESGLIILIGATTENPSFEVNAALLSRCRVYVLQLLNSAALRRIGEQALGRMTLERASKESGPDPAAEPGGALPGQAEHGIPVMTEEAWEPALLFADGDARRLLNLLEIAGHSLARGETTIRRDRVDLLVQRGIATRHGREDHFDWISALHKSLRGSDPHAGLYWLARMLEAGEDPKFIVRRLIVFASEDVGLAEPGALVHAIAAKEAVDFVGMPECYLALSQIVVYLALAPKSNSLYVSYQRAASLVREEGARPVPLHIRNAPTRLMKDLGYGKEYRYPHDEPDRWVALSYLPDGLEGSRIYRPSLMGREPRLVEDHRRRTMDFYELRSEEAAGPRQEAEEKPEEGSQPS